MGKSIKVIFLPSVRFELDLNSLNVNHFLSQAKRYLKFSNRGKTILIKP